MIKIVHLITDLLTGGAEMMLFKLVSNMDRSKFENIVVSMTDTEPFAKYMKAAGIPVYSLSMRRGIPDPMGFFKLIKILKREKPAILQTWLYHADLLGLVAGKFSHIPTIIWNLRCSDMDMNKYSKVTGLVVKILARLSFQPALIIANSNAGQVIHSQLGYHPPKWEIIPNGFDLDLFRPDSEAKLKLRTELGLNEDQLLIGLIARFDSMKDHMNFLQAASLLLERGKQNHSVHFVLAGSGVTPDNIELTKTIEELALGPNIHLLGERKDISLIMAALDVCSLSSSYGEGFPNVVGEAMACAVPCVVTDVGDSALIVGDTGRVVPARTPLALADAWNDLLCMNMDERIQLGLAARKRIGEQFSLNIIVARYESLYKDLCTY